MSILAEILESVQNVDAEFINKKIPEIKRNVDHYKNELITYFQEVYIQYKKRPSCGILQNKIVTTSDNLKLLKEKANDMLNKNIVETNEKLGVNITELEKIEYELSNIKNIQNILTLLIEIDSEIQNKNYLKSVKILHQLKQSIENIPDELCIKEELSNRIKTEAENRLSIELESIVGDNIKIDQLSNSETCFRIKKSNEELQTALIALYKINEYVNTLKGLTKSLWESVLIPLVENEVTIDQLIDNNFVILKIQKEMFVPIKLSYKEVFSNLTVFVEFFSHNFNYALCEGLNAVEYISMDLRDNLVELIISKCLKQTIPSTEIDLQNYGIIREETEKLETKLIELKIFETTTTSLSDYVNNVDELFINNKCEEYVNKATAIMKKDLHNSVTVGVPYNEDKLLGESIDSFPECCISKHVNELLTFCHTILEKAIISTPKFCTQLYTTVTNIIKKYPIFIMETHKQYLDTLPQQVALIYNNCRYIANTLGKWNRQYGSNFESDEMQIDFIIDIRQYQIVAIDILNNFIEKQVQNINDTLDSSGLENMLLDKLDPKTEKCVRQCLRQQELLRTVWYKILPRNIYDNNMGIIVNATCKRIIDLIIKSKDISAKVAEDLVDINRMVVNRVPKLFGKSEEICLFVPTWYKFNEVIFVLDSSLIEIEARWAEGKGPLALHMEIKELERLIKALFQDTSRRANLLACITKNEQNL